VRDNMKIDAYEIADKIKKYWCALYPKNSGEISKKDKHVKVVVITDRGCQEVVGVHITDDFIQLELEENNDKN
jgi:hypothetical protein